MNNKNKEIKTPYGIKSNLTILFEDGDKVTKEEIKKG